MEERNEYTEVRMQKTGGRSRPQPWPQCFCLRFCILQSAFCLVANAQPFAIEWYTTDGGSGTSTGGVYSVSGTIGQPDESVPSMTGGNFSLTGGFWSLYANLTPGATVLTVVPAGPGQAQLSWTPDTPGFVLQETLSLSPTYWVNSTSGTTNPIVVLATLTSRFYRLQKS